MATEHISVGIQRFRERFYLFDRPSKSLCCMPNLEALGREGKPVYKLLAVQASPTVVAVESWKCD